MAGLQVTTQATAEPITLQDVKDYLRVEDAQDERVLQDLIETARRFCEEHTKRAIMPQTLTLTVDAYDELADPLWEGWKTGPYINYYKNYIDLARCPVVSVTSVKTYNDADVATTMSASQYYVDNVREPARVVLRTGETFPTALRVANAIEVVYVAGYSNQATVPSPLKIGMLQHIAFLYEHRGDMYEGVKMPASIKTLYGPYVVYKGGGSSSISAIG